MKALVIEEYSKAEVIRVVMDNLNIHKEKSFYETFIGLMHLSSKSCTNRSVTNNILYTFEGLMLLISHFNCVSPNSVKMKQNKSWTRSNSTTLQDMQVGLTLPK
jgi:hypothetical protein